jgi:hypothetical protein
MDVPAPGSLHEEHQELRHFLAKAAREEAELGEAARLVARLLEGHMEKEEKFALPPLQVLPALARGKFKPQMADLLAQTDWLKAHLSEMISEHHAILAGLERLMAAARAADRFEYVEFAEKLIHHARMEEEVLYPAVIVLGEYLKLKLEATLELNQ